MDDKRDKPAADNNASPTAQDDAQQFFRWMTDYGRPALIGVLVAAVVVLGTTTWRSQKQAKADAAMQALFMREKVVTVHSEEATLEDIFIRVTGRGLN